MLDCWRENPDIRPSFAQCKGRIARCLEQQSPSAYQSILIGLSEAWLKLSSSNESNSTLDNAGSDKTFDKPQDDQAVIANVVAPPNEPVKENEIMIGHEISEHSCVGGEVDDLAAPYGLAKMCE